MPRVFVAAADAVRRPHLKRPARKIDHLQRDAVRKRNDFLPRRVRFFASPLAVFINNDDVEREFRSNPRLNLAAPRFLGLPLAFCFFAAQAFRLFALARFLVAFCLFLFQVIQDALRHAEFAPRLFEFRLQPQRGLIRRQRRLMLRQAKPRLPQDEMRLRPVRLQFDGFFRIGCRLLLQECQILI